MASGASQGGANLVKFFFYQGATTKATVRQRLVALAYATARDLKLAPTKILIRAELHNTTSQGGGGKHIIDPMGWHLTMAFKDDNQVIEHTHIASHGYTTGKTDYVLEKATHGDSKPDDTPRGKKGNIVWPDERDLDEYVDSPIAYSHLPDPEE